MISFYNSNWKFKWNWSGVKHGNIAIIIDKDFYVVDYSDSRKLPEGLKSSMKLLKVLIEARESLKKILYILRGEAQRNFLYPLRYKRGLRRF